MLNSDNIEQDINQENIEYNDTENENKYSAKSKLIDLTEPLYVQKLDQEGYALLMGADFKIILTELSAILGRSSKSKHESVDINLGDNPFISRKHAHIEYDFISAQFRIRCLSKNGLHLNGKYLFPHDGFVQLPSKSYVEIGNIQFIFLTTSEKSKILIENEHEHLIKPVKVNITQSSQVREITHKQLKRNAYRGRRVSGYSGIVKVIDESEDVPHERNTIPVIDIEPISLDTIQEEDKTIVESGPDISNRNKKRKRTDETPTVQQPIALPVDSENNAQYEKPKLSFTQIIRMALDSTPDKKLSFSEICDWMVINFPYFAVAETSKWHNSVRHQLSTGSSFVLVPRTSKDRPGKGGFWMLKESLQI